MFILRKPTTEGTVPHFLQLVENFWSYIASSGTFESNS